MHNLSEQAFDYFAPPKDYYWRWAENVEITEWQNGTTICYREELLHIMRHLVGNDLPRLGTLLLVLSACHDDWRKNTGGLGILSGIKMLVDSTSMSLKTGKEEIAPLIQEAGKFLDTINQLPREYRTGAKRLLLLHGITQSFTNNIPAKEAQHYIHEFSSGRLDEQIKDANRRLTREYFEADLTSLKNALKIFPDAEILELKIRTGVDIIPRPVEEIEIPEERAADLLDELDNDPRTSGLAKLTRRLVAALNIPMHTHGSSDQSYGGVSDITNRGNFDRLLLSELAYDDDTLTARLANNESLYLRREELPSNLEQHRKILIDTTLKMWGIPRVFAIAVALACARNNKINATIDSYSLSGTGFNPVDLYSKKGIVEALEQLEPSIDCRKGFVSCMNADVKKGVTEYFFITTEESMHSPSMQAALAEIKESLTYLITVSRDGRLEFHEFIAKRRKLLSTAKFNLNELFFSPVVRLPQTTFENAPAFLGCNPPPLYFPASKLKMSGWYMLHNAAGVIAVTIDHRVLYWSEKQIGATEVLSFIDEGRYAIGFEKENTNSFYILVINDKTELVKLHSIALPDLTVTITDFTGKIQAPYSVVFSTQFLIKTLKEDIYFIEPNTATLLEKTSNEKFGPTFEKIRSTIDRAQFGRTKKFLNNGHSTINSVDRISAHKTEGISLDNKYICLYKVGETHKIGLIHKKPANGYGIFAVRKDTISPQQLGNKSIRFYHYIWTDGSEAWIDSRGLLHLRSSDKSLAEITIIIIIGGPPSACWASDGTVSGSAYFTGTDQVNMPEEEFYEKYIQRFINTLR